MNLAEYYVWLKAAHVACALVFVGGVMAVSVFMQVASTSNSASQTLAVAVRRWDRLVTVPAMLLVWGFGLTLMSAGHWSKQPWLWFKFTLVILVSATHGVQSGKLRRLSAGHNVPHMRSLPLIIWAVAAIAFLVVAKPF